ncbi:MAG: sulfatase family protein [Acidimicrobiales bacterium]
MTGGPGGTEPNFVFIMTDQHRADYLGCTGHPVLRTPNIDAVAARGTIMNRFHVSSPVCMPNRAVFVTGLLSSVNGVRQNGNDLPHSITTFPELLSAAGYDTALIGKSHLQTMTAAPTPIGDNPAGNGRLANAVDIGDEDRYRWEDPHNWAANGPLRFDTPFYGFDTVDLVTFHGDRTGGHHLAWQADQVGDPEMIRGAENQLPHDYGCPQAIRTAVPEELYSTRYIADRAVEYLREPARAEAPFFAFVSFPDPHHPFTPPGRYWDMYAPEAMPDDENLATHANPPPHLRWVRRQPFPEGPSFQTEAVQVKAEHLQEAKALTCGMIAMIDDAVGAIVDTLESQGLGDNTIIVFTADHGDYLGHHGLLFKGGMHFQSLIRLPMIWADPRVDQPTTSDVLASTLDLAPTILSAAGVTPTAGLQGIDLTPALIGSGAAHGLEREEILIEEQTYFPNILGFDGQVRVRSLLRDRWRLTVYLGVDWGELYNLADDPLECHNLWDDPAHLTVRNDLLWRLVQNQIGYAAQSPWPKQEA